MEVTTCGRQGLIRSISLKMTILVMAGVFAATMSFIPRLAQAEDDLNVDSDAVSGNTAAAIANAKLAQERAIKEKAEAEHERQVAKEEIARSKQLESDAKIKMEDWDREEKQHHHDRTEAEAKTDKARKEISRLKLELSAREMELQAETDAVDDIQREKDKTDEQLRDIQKKITEAQNKISQTLLQQGQLHDKTDLSKMKLEEGREKFHELEKTQSSIEHESGPVASVNKPGEERMEGWVKVRRPCSVKTEASDESSDAKQTDKGEKLFGRKVGGDWLFVRARDGKTGYMKGACLR
jgi:hypothetical protein